jgi:hypothetical protein
MMIYLVKKFIIEMELKMMDYIEMLTMILQEKIYLIKEEIN